MTHVTAVVYFFGGLCLNEPKWKAIVLSSLGYGKKDMSIKSRSRSLRRRNRTKLGG
jgi:hypothetical protein